MSAPEPLSATAVKTRSPKQQAVVAADGVLMAVVAADGVLMAVVAADGVLMAGGESIMTVMA